MSRPAPTLRRRLIAVFGVLLALNLGAWAWAVLAFHGRPALLGIALLVYGLGLRHAVDADHIAAIDNVTRKLMQAGQRPVGVGLFFALGHSAVVIVATGAVAAAVSALGGLQGLQAIGGLIGTSVSALFLFAIAAMNIVILASIWRNWRRVVQGGAYVAEDMDMLLGDRGFLARIFRPLFRLITQSWHMLPLGMLFGLGFDTATEVAMFGVAAAQATQGVSFGAVLVLPVLFAAGMSLVDTADGVLMLGAYEWAFIKPVRKLYYNMTITLLSVVIAVAIGGIELLGLIADQFALSGGVWDVVGRLNDNFGTLGFAVIGAFLAAWVLSWVVYRVRGYDALDVRGT